MRTVTKKIFKFHELSSTAQDQAIKNMQNQDDALDSEWYESIYNDIKSYLALMGMSNVDIEFDGFYSQGDYAHFSADFDTAKIDLVKLAEYAPNIAEKFSQYLNDLPKVAITASFSDSHSTSSIEIEELDEKLNLAEQELFHAENGQYEYEEYPASDATLTVLQKTIKNLESERIDAYEKAEFVLKELHTELCKNIFNQLKNEYEWLLSDEHIRSLIEINDYQFTEDGSFYA